MKYYLAIFTTIVLFSTVEVVIKLISAQMDPILLAFIRFGSAGLILTLIDYKKLFLIQKKDIPGIFLLTVFGVTAGFAWYHSSLRYLTASTGAVIFSLNPIFSSITASYLLKEKLSIQQFLGTILGFIGVYILSFGFSLPLFYSIKGPILMILAAIMFGFYISGIKAYVKKYGLFCVNGVTFFIGALFLMPLIKTWYIPLHDYSIAYIVYLVIFATSLAYVLYFYGLNRVSIAAGCSLFYLKPVIAPVLAVCILNDVLSAYFYFGLCIILTALGFTTFLEIRANQRNK